MMDAMILEETDAENMCRSDVSFSALSLMELSDDEGEEKDDRLNRSYKGN